MAKIVWVVPVYNEEAVLWASITTLQHYFSKHIKGDWLIVIANNASTDTTLKIAKQLSKKLPGVRYEHMDFKGRGNALKYVWRKYNAAVYGYCDVDLATDISDIKTLIDSIKDGADIAIGNRYITGSGTKRTFKRLIFSKIYIWMVRVFFKTAISDFQCGFKAVSGKVQKTLLPNVLDKGWFFDTELLLKAEQEKQFKISQIPVRWRENDESKVRLIHTSIIYIKKLLLLRFGRI
jgi:glycosyltransferase involved in cell wall biosynthesis